MHFDWGASQFVTQQIQVGLVGYIYDQLSCDSGSGDHVGCFESRVAGVGPQIGYFFPVGGMKGYINLKAYAEFDAVVVQCHATSCSQALLFRACFRHVP